MSNLDETPKCLWCAELLEKISPCRRVILIVTTSIKKKQVANRIQKINLLKTRLAMLGVAVMDEDLF